jgi:hypothetical protein
LRCIELTPNNKKYLGLTSLNIFGRDHVFS